MEGGVSLNVWDIMENIKSKTVAITYDKKNDRMELPTPLKHALAIFVNIGTIGVLTHNFHWWVKLLYSILIGVGGILYVLNQWHSFYKNYKTYWIVVKIEHLIKFIDVRRRKPRRRGIAIRRSARNKYP